MCGRFTNAVPFEVLSGEVNAELRLVAYYDAPRYNIAPTQEVACVRQAGEGPWEVTMLRWGLIPSWAKDPKIGARMINARSDTVAEKPSFRSAFKRRRCVVVADGWYEWQGTAGAKQPYHLHFDDHRPLGFAGLWESWSQGEETIESCTIITTDASTELATVHDRMPVILPVDDYPTWLDTTFEGTEHLKSLLQPWDQGELIATAVSKRVNQVRNDEPDNIAPVPLDQDLFS